MDAKPTSSDGFTLIEMMVSLALVSLVGMAGLALVDSLSTVQLRTDDRYARMTDLQIFLAGVSEDFEQAISQTLVLDNRRLEVETRRCGRPEPAIYEIAETTLTRARGSCAPGGSVAVDLERVSIHVVDERGAFRTEWPPGTDTAATIGQPSPPRLVGVEIQIQLQERPAMPSGLVRRLVDLPEAPAP